MELAIDMSALISLFVMIVVFLVIYLKTDLPISVPLLAASVGAALVAGFGFPIRHYIEGLFAYFDIVLIIITGVVFFRVLSVNGCLEGMIKLLAKKFSRYPVVILFIGMVFLYIPGMFTGLGIPGTVSAGAVLTPIFIQMGMAKAVTAALVALLAMLGSVTGPINIPAMIVAGGINMPYEGFERILPLFTVPLGIATTIILGLRPARKANVQQLMERFKTEEKINVFKTFAPLVIVLLMLISLRVFPRHMPDLGTPLVFVIGTVIGMFSGKKIKVWETLTNALDGFMYRLSGLLLTVGVLVQIMTLTGIRGIVTVGALAVPPTLLYASMAIILPGLGGTLTMLGIAAVMGIPYATILIVGLGLNEFVVVSAISILCALSQITPPTSIVGLMAKEISGAKKYAHVLKAAWVPSVVIIAFCLVVTIYARGIASFLGIG